MTIADIVDSAVKANGRASASTRPLDHSLDHPLMCLVIGIEKRLLLAGPHHISNSDGIADAGAAGRCFAWGRSGLPRGRGRRLDAAGDPQRGGGDDGRGRDAVGGPVGHRLIKYVAVNPPFTGQAFACASLVSLSHFALDVEPLLN